MNRHSFFAFLLIIAVALMQAYGVFREYFQRGSLIKDQFTYLERELEQERFRRQLSHFKYLDFRQQVASQIPALLDKYPEGAEEAYPLRNLASVTGEKDADHRFIDFSEREFEKARSVFRDGDYESAAHQFEKFIDRYSYSSSVAEAFFLLAESHYQLRHTDEVVNIVSTMIDHFPESELTGFALLRMAKIFELRGRPEDAIDIYKKILQFFPYPDLADQARRSLKEVSLL